jgi:hypothetical protein
MEQVRQHDDHDQQLLSRPTRNGLLEGDHQSVVELEHLLGRTVSPIEQLPDWRDHRLRLRHPKTPLGHHHQVALR